MNNGNNIMILISALAHYCYRHGTRGCVNCACVLASNGAYERRKMYTRHNNIILRHEIFAARES